MTSGEELRCACDGSRLLAMVGWEGDEAFIHIKSFGGGKARSEVKITSGTVRILCLSCNRWTRVVVWGPDYSVTNPSA